MGLSDEERISKMYGAVCNLTTAASDLSVGEHYGLTAEGILQIKGLADQLWDAFLGSKVEGAYWILGGDSDNPVTGPSGAWSAAIVALCDHHREDPSRIDMDEIRADLPFNPFDHFLTVRGLVGVADKTLEGIYDIYGWTEALSYALRRYDDKLLASHRRLSKIVSDIQGACYGLFVRNEVYGRAYVLNRLLEGLYGSRYAPEGTDSVRDLFLDSHMHHNLSRPMRDGSLKECIAWDEWRLTHKPTPENRLVLAMRIAGRRFHYDHEFARMLKAIKTMKPRPRIKVLQAEFDKCQKAHTEESEGSGESYRKEKEREEKYIIHGFRSFDWDRPKPMSRTKTIQKAIRKKAPAKRKKAG